MTTAFHPGGPPIGKLTARQVAFLVENGLFQNVERFELADGYLIEKDMQKFRHQFGVRALERVFVNRTVPPHDAHGNCTIGLGPNDVFDADLAVLKASLEALGRNPEAQDVALVCEVSDSTLAYDLQYKRLAYARAGVPIYWVLDMTRSKLIVHEHPADGDYREVRSHEGDEMIDVPFVASKLRLADLFPVE